MKVVKYWALFLAFLNLAGAVVSAHDIYYSQADWMDWFFGPLNLLVAVVMFIHYQDYLNRERQISDAALDSHINHRPGKGGN